MRPRAAGSDNLGVEAGCVIRIRGVFRLRVRGTSSREQPHDMLEETEDLSLPTLSQKALTDDSEDSMHAAMRMSNATENEALP